MNDQKGRIVRLTGVVDIALIAVLIIRGRGWLGSVILVEAAMWLVRLVWISPILLRFILRRLLHMIPIILTTIALGFFPNKTRSWRCLYNYGSESTDSARGVGGIPQKFRPEPGMVHSIF